MLSPVSDSSAAPPPDGSPDALPPPGVDVVGPLAPSGPNTPRMTRGRALAEVVLCSSYPTQVAAAGALALLGVPPQTADGTLNAAFVFGVSTLDAVLVVSLVVYLLRRQHESLAQVFLGDRARWREAALGVALVPLVTVGVAVVVRSVQALFPELHNVPVNPLTAFMIDPAMAVAFGVMVVVAGGVREEMQRAFQLHRLQHHVTSPFVALFVTSVAFGLGHTVQGRDVAIATFGLGLFWGALYLRRRSLVASGVSHALFNLLQVWAASHTLIPPG